MALCSLWLGAPAAAQSLAPLDISGTYLFSMAGVPFGSMDFSATQNANNYDASADIHTTGLVRVFVQHDSHTTSKGAGANFTYPDSTYESDYQTRKKKKYVKMVRKHNKIAEETITPPDDRNVRPAVEEALKNEAFNPLAYALELRGKMAQCIAANCESFNFNFFDGRRLTQGTFTPQGTKVIRIGGQKYPTYYVIAKRKPLAGFTAKELKGIPADEPPLAIYFSQDEKLLPVKLDYPMAFGTASAVLKQ